MSEHMSVWKRMTEAAGSRQELFPGTPLIEIAGTGRVYIENHRKILLYTESEIHIGVKYGTIIILGDGLGFSCISREYLVVSGRVSSVLLNGKEGK